MPNPLKFTRIEETVLYLIIGSTSGVVDRERQLAALAYGRDRNCFELAKSMLFQMRREWLDYLTMTQRRWQRETRNPNKARHHDSISLREKYVRCHDGEETFRMKMRRLQQE